MKKIVLLMVFVCLTSGCSAMNAACFAWSGAKAAYDLADGFQARQRSTKYVTPTKASQDTNEAR